MNSLDFKCRHCEKRITADESCHGEIVVCPFCRGKTFVPGGGLRSGALFGDFTLIRNMTVNEVSETWLARKEEKKVKLKIMSRSMMGSPRFVTRFIRESSHLARLGHPAFEDVIEHGLKPAIPNEATLDLFRIVGSEIWVGYAMAA